MATATLTTTAVAGGVLTSVDKDVQSNGSIAQAASASNVFKQSRTDNRNNTERVYTKVYNSAGPTIGTTAPDIQIPCHAGEMIEIRYPAGITLGTGLAFITAQEPGTPASGPTTNPSIDVEASVGRA